MSLCTSRESFAVKERDQRLVSLSLKSLTIHRGHRRIDAILRDQRFQNTLCISCIHFHGRLGPLTLRVDN